MDVHAFLDGLGRVFAAGDTGEVDGYLRRGMARALEEKDKSALITVLNEMVGYYRSVSRYEDALRAAEHAIEEMEKLGCADSVPFGTTLLNAATAYRASGDNGKALDYFNRALAIYQRDLPADDYRLAGLYNNISAIHQDVGRYGNAAQLLGTSLAILSGIRGAEVDAATVAANLALVLFKLDNVDEAREALDVAFALFGPEDDGETRRPPHYAAALAGLAEAHFCMGEYPKAVDMYVSALAHIKTCYGENEDYATTCRNCATACERMGDHAAAAYRSAADAVATKIRAPG